MTEKSTKLSVIVLAYNEEAHLPACLKALAAQTVMPDEVIVVDNNSTDDSAKIARSFPFVTLVHESKQGMIHARNRGFNEATGDILARIDADARVVPDWSENLKRAFANDPNNMGVAGVARTALLPYTGLHTTMWTAIYLFWVRVCFNVPMLWGVNMAIRRSAWQQIAAELQTDSNLVHEDQDISVIMAKHRLSIVVDKAVCVVSENQDKFEWSKYWLYFGRMISTIRLHRRLKSLSDIKGLYSPAQRLLCVVLAAPLKIIYLCIMVATTSIAAISRRV